MIDTHMRATRSLTASELKKVHFDNADADDRAIAESYKEQNNPDIIMTHQEAIEAVHSLNYIVKSLDRQVKELEADKRAQSEVILYLQGELDKKTKKINDKALKAAATLLLREKAA